MVLRLFSPGTDVVTEIHSGMVFQVSIKWHGRHLRMRTGDRKDYLLSKKENRIKGKV